MRYNALFAILLIVAFSSNALTVNADRCVEMALAASEQLASARKTAEQAGLHRGVARTAYLPKLEGSFTTGWELPDSKYEDMGLTLKMHGLYMAGINLTQPVFAGGKIVAANRMAEIGVKAAADRVEMTRDQVAADAEISYWTYVAVLAKVDMMRSYMSQIDSVYRRTLVSVEAGMATKNDLLRIEARRSQIEYQLERTESGADMCRMALCSAIGLDTDTNLDTENREVPADVPADLDCYDLEMRPEMRLFAHDVDIKEQQVKSVRADYLPTIGLQAGWMAYGNIKLNSMAQGTDGTYYPVSQNIKNNNFTIMLGLKVPLFQWGEGHKKVKAAKIDAEISRLTLQENRRLMNLQVEQCISNVRTGRTMLSAAEKSMVQADASLASTRQRYEVGMNTLTDLLDAQSQWQAAYSDLIEARTQLRIYVVEYLRATSKI